jgi:hypothetical protein
MMREYQVRICERLGVKFPGLLGKVGRTQPEQMSSGLLKSGHRFMQSACLKSATTGSQMIIDYFVDAILLTKHLNAGAILVIVQP